MEHYARGADHLHGPTERAQGKNYGSYMSVGLGWRHRKKEGRAGGRLPSRICVGGYLTLGGIPKLADVMAPRGAMEMEGRAVV